jgi:HEPN domain-containing protein
MTRPRTLLESAKRFLVESLVNYRDHKNDFAIVHAVTAAELVLKERLARIHPALIYRNIDKPLPKAETVRLRDLPQRLHNLGVPVDGKEIEKFAEWRNEIVHHAPSFDERTARGQLPRLLDFVAAFLRNELSTPLEKFLPIDLYKDVHGILADWETAVAAARKQATTEGNVLEDGCPVCQAVGVLCLQDEDQLFCYLCETIRAYGWCRSCKTMTGIVASGDEENYCDDCLDAAGEQYMSFQEDLRRGK